MFLSRMLLATDILDHMKLDVTIEIPYLCLYLLNEDYVIQTRGRFVLLKYPPGLCPLFSKQGLRAK